MFRALRSHKLYVPLITIVGSGALFFIYYFFYVSSQRSYANERAFRLLAVVGDQMVKRFDNLRNILAASLVAHDPDAKQYGAEKYLEYVLQDEISAIRYNPPTSVPLDRNGAFRLTLIDKPGDFSLTAEYRPPGSKVDKTAACEEDSSTAYVCADVDLVTDLRRRFHTVTDEYFDDILIATSTGEVIFQKSLSGLRIGDLNALVPPKPQESTAQQPETVPLAKGGKPGNTLPAVRNRSLAASSFSSASKFSNVIDVTLGGTGYKLYLQPVPVVILGPDGQEIRPVVCGLWRSDRFQSEVVSIPYATLIWGTLLLLTAFAMVWPLLKVAYMSPSERLLRRHALYLLFSTLLVTTLLTLIVLNWSYTLRNNEESEEQLEHLAKRIDLNLRTELLRALTFLDALGPDEYSHAQFRRVTNTHWTAENFLQSAFCDKRHDRCSYPYFDNTFWVDKDGQQQFKLTVRARATPRTLIDAESYFQDARDDRHLMTAPATTPSTAKGSKTKFAFDARYSTNTGEFFVVIAKPYKIPESWNDLPDQVHNLRVHVLVAKFLSLVEPVVPAGFGFAVVDHEGMVQFHSNPARNRIEDLFKETQQNPALKALVLNGGSDYLDVNYLGKRQQMFVMSLPYLAVPAPALVVFRDSNYFDTVNVACILVFTLLACLFSLPFMVGLARYVFRPGEYPLAALWPSLEDVSKYLDVITANICLTVAFAIRFPSMKMDETLITVLAMIAVTVVFCGLQSNWARGRWPLVGKAVLLLAILVVARRSFALLAAGIYIALAAPKVSEALDKHVKNCIAKRFIKVKDLYLGVVLSLLVVIGVLPCFGLFKISYNTVNRLNLENAQLARRDQLIHRADDVQGYFLGLESKEDKDREDQDVKNRLLKYADERLQEDLDRYDKPVYNPNNSGEAIEDTPDVSSLEQSIARASGFFPSNRLGAELRETAMADERWRKNRDGAQPPELDVPSREWSSKQDKDEDDQLLRLKDTTVASPGGNPQIGDLLGVYPLWQLPWPAAVLMTMLAVLLAVWLRFLIRKVFLTETEDVPQLEPWAPSRASSRSLLIIGHPKSGKGTRAAALPDVDMLDLAKVVTTGNWMLHALYKPTTVVDHFEFDMDNPDTCFQKLKLLETLLYVDKKRVILLSAVDPMFYLASSCPEALTPSGANQEPPSQLLDRWAALLSLFDRQKMEDVTEHYLTRSLAEQENPCCGELVELVVSECDHTAQLRRIGLDMLEAHCHEQNMSNGKFVEELLDRADSYYRVLWSTCTREERLVLFQLAQDGWVNPKNERAIQQLQRRGIIRRGSGFRIMNDSFSRFVRNAQSPEEVARWEQEEEHSTWSAVKLGLGTAVMMFGAWLLYAQQDVFQLGIGYVAALGTASGAVINLVRNLTGGGSASSGQGVKAG